MRKMYLFTARYPYGKGEKPFIVPELEALRACFDIVVVSGATREDVADEANASKLPKDVLLVHCPKASRARLALHALLFPFSSAGREEIKDILEDGISFGRILDAIKLFSNALCLRRSYSKAGIFDDSDNAVYYSFWFDAPSLALCMEKASTEDLRLASRIHGFDLFNEVHAHNRQPFQRFKRDHVDKIIFPSEHAKMYFTESFGLEAKPSQYELNRLGVDSHRSIACASNLKKICLVSCSNVNVGKRVSLIAEGIEKLGSGYDVEWIHFGDGPLLNELKTYAVSREIPVRFVGYAPNEQIIRFYQSNYVDAVILTTAHEGGCPVCLQEAISFGIPVIGTSVGGVPELIDGNGVLLPPDPTPQDVANAIKTVCCSSPEIIAAMRRRSLEIWEEDFDSKKNKKRLIDIINTMTSSGDEG